MANLYPLIFLDEDVLRIPQRPYEFDKGDRRFTSLMDAVSFANDEAVRTGVRQVVRLDSSPHFVTLHLVQAMGS